MRYSWVTSINGIEVTLLKNVKTRKKSETMLVNIKVFA